MQSMSENDFECLASTGVSTPATISPNSGCLIRIWAIARLSSAAEVRRVAPPLTTIAVLAILVTFHHRFGQVDNASPVQARLLVWQGHRIGGPVTFPNGQVATDGR
jgi:hypothetical protein